MVVSCLQAEVSVLFHDLDVKNKINEEINETIINKLHDKHCPMRIVHVLTEKFIITSLLIHKLMRGKQRAHKRKEPSRKLRAKPLSN